MSYDPSGGGGGADVGESLCVMNFDWLQLQASALSSWEAQDRIFVPASSTQASTYPKVLLSWRRNTFGSVWMALGQGTQQTDPATNGIGTTQKANKILNTWNDPATLLLVEIPTPDAHWDDDSCVLDWGATSVTTAFGKTLNAEWGTNISLSEPTIAEIQIINNNSGVGNGVVSSLGFISDGGDQV